MIHFYSPWKFVVPLLRGSHVAFVFSVINLSNKIVEPAIYSVQYFRYEMNCIAFVVEKEIAEKFINDNELNNTLNQNVHP
jgi:hypothetical protein